MTKADVDLANAAVDAGLFWHLDRWRRHNDVLSVRGIGSLQMARLVSKSNFPLDIRTTSHYGTHWIAKARAA